MNFMRRNVGQLIVASAVIDDTTGWVIIAITLGIATTGAISPGPLAITVIGTAIFLTVAFTVGRRAAFEVIRWTNDNLHSDLPVTTAIIGLMCVLALVTAAIGVQTVLGAFIAGLLIGQSPILTRQIDEQLRGLITALFMPVFFGLAGLTADLTILKDPQLLLLTAGLVAIATVGKFSGAFAGGAIGGLSMRESLAIASGMNARGSTEVIVATIGLSMGVLSQNLFTMVVTMAVLTTLAMPPMLRWSLGRIPMRKEEKERIEREEFEAKGFMPNVERLLLAVDDSGNGKFAARLTGLLAGGRGTPTTLLRVREADKATEAKEPDEAGPESDLKAAAEIAREVEAEDEKKKAEQAKAEKQAEKNGTSEAAEKKAIERKAAQDEKPAKPSKPPVPVVKAEAKHASADDAIKKEARKGYDLLMLGIKDTLGPDGALHQDLARIAAGFDGPLGVVLGRGAHVEDPSSGFRLLVPVSGNNVSRRAAEVAVALARAQDVPITFLYVASGDRKGRRGMRVLHQHEQAVLKELVTWAERYDTKARTAIRTDMTPQEAILRELRSGRFDLVVMGVNRRPGDALFFGNVAGDVIEQSKVSILLLSS
jgi:nucleotide-binding universal stress UspA family protein